MNMNQINRAAVVAIAAGIACSNIALADDTNAQTRLESARIAFELAKAELEAAQAEVAATSQGEIEIDTDNSTSRDQPESDAQDEIPADPSSWTDGWDWNASAGFSGASGNNENFSARVSVGGQRNTSKYETSLSLSYLYGTSDGTKNTARGEFKIHNDWLTDGKWRYFAQGGYEYDEFQAWQHRFSGAGGVGYEFINDDKTTLIGRAGLGGSYEAGSAADEKFIPEGLLGLDWTYQLSTNTSLKASTTYYPSFDEFGEFRWNSGAGIEVILDSETGMTMNAGIEHRHDSQPGTGIKPNDVDYYMGVGWKF
jgi:putative salt-induced outer membrane protein YdiY